MLLAHTLESQEKGREATRTAMAGGGGNWGLSYSRAGVVRKKMGYTILYPSLFSRVLLHIMSAQYISQKRRRDRF